MGVTALTKHPPPAKLSARAELQNKYIFFDKVVHPFLPHRIVNALERLAETIPVTEGEPQTTITQNVGVGVLCPNTTGVTFSSTSSSAQSSDLGNYSIRLQEGDALVEMGMTDVGFLVPNSAISTVQPSSSNKPSSAGSLLISLACWKLKLCLNFVRLCETLAELILRRLRGEMCDFTNPCLRSGRWVF